MILPETAPFSPSQRAWLNGFFAGVLGFDNCAAPRPPNGMEMPSPDPPNAEEQAEDFPLA